MRDTVFILREVDPAWRVAVDAVTAFTTIVVAAMAGLEFRRAEREKRDRITAEQRNIRAAVDRVAGQLAVLGAEADRLLRAHNELGDVSEAWSKKSEHYVKAGYIKSRIYGMEGQAQAALSIVPSADFSVRAKLHDVLMALLSVRDAATKVRSAQLEFPFVSAVTELRQELASSRNAINYAISHFGRSN